MARTIGIGYQDFEQLITNHVFYVDKTAFIKEWWENKDVVTLITRPRRFGKTLNMSMLEQFLSVEYADRGDLFEGLSIWEDEKYQKLQGTLPVISLSFANVKETAFLDARKRICQIICDLYNRYDFLLKGDCLNEKEKEQYQKVSAEMENYLAADALYALSRYLYRYYGKKVIILLDEYDTPMQEAYVHGYWKELVEFIKGIFNSAFKTNPYLDRAVLTGITRVSKESIFSDLNHLEVVTATSEKYETAFGFTQQEVWEALEECGLSDKKEEVKAWYDGFTMGKESGIYNPWSILNYLDKQRFAPYWANTSSNRLVGKLIQVGSRETKLTIESLLRGESFCAQIDEQIVYEQLDLDESAIWSLFLAGGYLKIVHYEEYMSEFGEWRQDYELALTNFEVKVMFRGLIRSWFAVVKSDYHTFTQALLMGDVEAMNAYMNRVSEAVFSSFDTGRKPSEKSEPERFYHGFVLGLLVDLNERYILTSNRESGYGRYDVQLEPRKEADDAILLEFKVRNPKTEETLEKTVENALAQIERRDYAVELRQKGFPEGRIRKYGFAFEGKVVLIGEG